MSSVTTKHECEECEEHTTHYHVREPFDDDDGPIYKCVACGNRVERDDIGGLDA